MTKYLPAAVLVAGALALSGCNRAPAPPEDPHMVAETDDVHSVVENGAPASDANASPTRESLPRITKAVREMVKERHPDSKVDGVWVLIIRENYVIAGADTTIDGRRRTINLLVRLYIRENGSDYWKAEGFGGDMARLLAPARAPIGQSDETTP
jgi:hypothetical protein